MTTTTDSQVSVRSDLRPPAWVYAGVALLAGSIGITWVLAGMPAGLSLMALIAGAAWVLRSRQARGRAGDGDRTVLPAPARVGRPDMATTDLLVNGLRHDLPRMAGLCRSLPSGGLPAAGTLAEHTYAVTDALGQLLRSDAPAGAGSPSLEHAGVLAQLAEVDRRAGRLHSSERTGGLDDLDWHLARLAVAVDEYGAEREAAGGPVLWSVGHCRRARILAWAAAANGVPAGRVGRREAWPTRAWLHLGISRRARRRAERLWGPGCARRSGPGSGSAVSSPPCWPPTCG